MALLVLKAICFLLPCQPGESEFGAHEHTVQLLEKRDDTPLSTVFEIDGTKTESCQQRKLLGLSAVAEVQRNSSSLGKVFSLIFAAAQHLDSSCTDCWNRAVRFGRLDLLELCANSDSSSRVVLGACATHKEVY